MKLSKERISALLREAFPAINARSLQVLINGYFHKDSLFYAVQKGQVRLNYWGFMHFEKLVERIKTEEEANDGEI